MSRDWHEWYRRYDDPGSSLSRRLEEVRRQLEATLRDRPAGRTVRLLSLCAGDGRDTLPVLAQGRDDVVAVLVELDDELAEAARRTAVRLGMAERTEVRVADAGTTTSATGATPADVVMLCGVLGNVSDADAARTVSCLPSLLAPGGVVIWTRGRAVDHDPTEVVGDPAERVRGLFAAAGFGEVAFVSPDDADYRVGVHRLDVAPKRFTTDVRMFDFV